MPYYQVSVRQDAYIFHDTIVEADSPEAAARLAKMAWDGKASLPVPLQETDYVGYDNAECDADDCEEVGEEDYQEAIASRAQEIQP